MKKNNEIKELIEELEETNWLTLAFATTGILIMGIGGWDLEITIIGSTLIIFSIITIKIARKRREKINKILK